MKSFIVLLLVAFVAVQARLKTNDELKRDITIVEGDGKIRAYEATWFPQYDPRIIQLKGVSVEKTGDSSATIDAVEFDFSTVLQTALAFGYFHAEGNIPNNFQNLSANIDASAFGFYLRAFAPFEYEEVNGVKGFQNGSDTILRGYDLSNLALPWKPLAINTTTITDEDNNEHNVFIIEAETEDEVFYMRFIVSGVPIDVAGVKITPDSCKVDFAIRWFNPKHVTALWTQGPTSASSYPNSQVGLLSAFAAVAASASFDGNGGGNGGDQPQLTFDSDAFTGFFTWAATADVTVTGVEHVKDVTADIIDASENAEYQAHFNGKGVVQVAIFSFDGIRPTEVAWDPEFGTRIDYDAVENAAGFVKPLAFFVLLAALLM
eukprot:TRINITY_DN2234_c0_g1_i1.p1 TRINITY_DN2234_c0_g1~~TRINITY_DN2234_c0_g1_i1.p1  ORF type:complete len:376 (+),score=89.22 TRINITY_DN2234_c0_g1_i1:95-1222(+)